MAHVRVNVRRHDRFQVAEGQGERFEQIWRERETHLDGVPGFVRFALLRGDETGVYISHSTWESREAFEAWTRSEAFTRGHSGPSMKGILETHPEVSTYEAVVAQEAAPAVARHA